MPVAEDDDFSNDDFVRASGCVFDCPALTPLLPPPPKRLRRMGAFIDTIVCIYERGLTFAIIPQDQHLQRKVEETLGRCYEASSRREKQNEIKIDLDSLTVDTGRKQNAFLLVCNCCCRCRWGGGGFNFNFNGPEERKTKLGDGLEAMQGPWIASLVVVVC